MSDRDKGLKDMLKQVYDMWEHSAGEQLEKLARSQVFVAAIAQNLETSLNITGRIREITQTTLSMMNLPTRQDLDAVSKQIRAMRSMLDEINEKLDAAETAKPAKSAKTKAKTKTTKTTKATKTKQAAKGRKAKASSEE